MQETKQQQPKAIFVGAVLFIHNYFCTIYPFNNLPWCNVDPSWHYSTGYSKLQETKEENINSFTNNETHWPTVTTNVKLNTGPHERHHIISLSVIHGLGVHRLHFQSYIITTPTTECK